MKHLFRFFFLINVRHTKLNKRDAGAIVASLIVHAKTPEQSEDQGDHSQTN